MKPHITDAVYNLAPKASFQVHGDTYQDILWLDEVVSCPEESLVMAELARLEQEAPLADCKEKAKQLLAQTDWAVLPDVGLANQDAFVFYRLNLRNLVKNPVADPVFEDVPQAIWS